MELHDWHNNRIICIDREATPEFWEERWESENFRRTVVSDNPRFLTQITRHFLPSKGSGVLEGGCGRGGKVLALSMYGNDVVGTDFVKASETF